MNGGLAPVSPFVYDSGADYLGRHIIITVPFNNATRAIQNGIVVHRDLGCVYTKIVVGVPTAGGSSRTAAVPDGDTSINAGPFRNATGFSSIDDILALQITAEP